MDLSDETKNENNSVPEKDLNSGKGKLFIPGEGF